MMWIVNGLYENRCTAYSISEGLIQTDETTWENSRHLENLMRSEKFVLLDWQYARLGGVIPQRSYYDVLLLRVMTLDGTVGWIRTNDSYFHTSFELLARPNDNEQHQKNEVP